MKEAPLANAGRLEGLLIPGRKALCIPKKGGKTDFVLVAFSR
ncbi:hypothetical protein [Pyrococcus yayanosii]|nr:hypothetical protein [Pyrococcus yayanosii]